MVSVGFCWFELSAVVFNDVPVRVVREVYRGWSRGRVTGD